MKPIIPVMRTALEQIQETHGLEILGFSEVYGTLKCCLACGSKWPCETRKLADEGLGGEERG